MTQIDDFFMYENHVEGITDADYQRAQPYVEAAQAFAQTTYHRAKDRLNDLESHRCFRIK